MSIELAEVFRQHAPSYLAEFGDKILPGHRQVITSVMACRTPALGGQAWQCDDCGKTHYSYHSCNDRHCPKCGNDDATDWLERQRSLLLPVPHFLVTFTVPQELRAWLRSNQKGGYNILMRCAAAAMEALCADPRHLGARPGLIAVLHTWSRKLVYHPHVHFLVPAGGFDAKGERWIHARDDYFLPSKALAASIRGRMKAAIAKIGHLNAIPRQVWEKAWVVDLQPAGSGEHALQYLARYVFRTALGGKKIVSCGDNHASFRYTDSTTNNEKTETLTPHVFLARYLQHVLPKGFTRIRYYGLFAPGNRKYLETVRRILRCPRGEPDEQPESFSLPKPFCCPDCQKPMTPGPPLFRVRQIRPP